MHVDDFGIFGGIERDGRTLFPHGVVVSEERAEDGGLRGNICGFRRLLVCDLVDQTGSSMVSTTDWKGGEQHSRFQTNHITDQLAFISFLVAHLARPVDERNALGPLVHGEFNLAREIMQMLD